MYAITKHFIGDPKVFDEKNSEILQNLRCKTLSDFKGYHDVFLAKLMSREDARASFWKEKFFYGLPRALTEKVQESLREKHNGTIPYEDLTYGYLIGEVKKEGLKLCSQLKLQYQVKKDLKASRKDLGSFCAQYGIEMPLPPSQRFKKQMIKTKNLIKKHKKEVRCFKCGQKGHIAPNCRKNKVNALSDKEEEYYFENNISSSKTDKSQTASEKEIEKIENCLCQVNMLTAVQELYVEMIDQIEDGETKAKYIRTILEHQNTKPKFKNNLSNSYQMKDIIKYYKKTRTSNNSRLANRNKPNKNSN